MNQTINKRRIVSVFLSSTGSDLIAERDAVYDAINRMPECKCIRMEDFVADPRPAHVVCESEVQQSDLFVGLVAFRYGSVINPDDPESLSYTEIEYNAAEAVDLPILMHIAPVSFKEAIHARQDDKFFERQLKFREIIQRKTMACPPNAWEETMILAMFVVEAVRKQMRVLEREL